MASEILDWWPLFVLGLIFSMLQLTPLIWQNLRGRDDAQDQNWDARRSGTLHPFPCWEIDQYGVIIWSNEAADAIGAPFLHRAYTAVYRNPDADHHRVRTEPGTKFSAMDVAATNTGPGLYLAAYPADQAERSEASQRAAVRTLANTFSHLSTGLVVFDKTQRLSTFNPATLDLTGLSFETLAKEQDIPTFLDLLRESGVLQEPRDYKSWRASFLRSIHDPDRANPAETWTQADGRTIRLTTRAHEDGSTALLLEDVTQSTDLLRALRQELDQAQRMLDNSGVPQILFDVMGSAICANAPYRAFWSHDVTASATPTTLHACCRMWQAKSQADQNWARLARLGAHLTPDRRQKFDIRLDGGAGFMVHCDLLPGQVTAIRFVDHPMSNSLAPPDMQLRA